jgi:hypothetical protein
MADAYLSTSISLDLMRQYDPSLTISVKIRVGEDMSAGQQIKA